MKGAVTILFLSGISLACKNIGQVNNYRNGNVLVAWNEDTACSYQFGIRNDRFAYAIIQKDSCRNKIKKYYYGRFQNVGDRIYLNYYNAICPSNMVTYLVKEISGNYLIQNFNDGSKRVFMRFNKQFDPYKSW